MRGLSLSDLDEMTLGGLIDFIIEYNNMVEEDDENKENIATQDDFDRF